MMVRKIYFILFLAASMTSCNENKIDQETPVEDSKANEKPVYLGDFNKKYEGEIAGKKIVMHLRLNGNVLHGYYYYMAYKDNLKLRGKIDTVRNTFKLTEIDPSDKISGEFTGVFANDFTISGTWKSITKRATKEFSIALKPTEQGFVWYKPFLPFHPVHLAGLSDFEGTTKKVKLQTKPDLKGVIMYKEEQMLETETAGYELDQEPMMRTPFFEYRYIGEYKGLYYLLVTESGGGTGIFSQIKVVQEKNGVLSEIESIAAGDRCMGGLQGAELHKNKLIYHQNVTAVDMYTLNTENPENMPNLDGCAICCVAQAVYCYDLNRKKSFLLHYELEDTGYPLPEDGQDSDMAYLMQLLHKHVEDQGTKLQLKDWSRIEKLLAARIKNE